jgi:hypothetical protein
LEGFTRTLARQTNVEAPNAFKGFWDAFNKARDEGFAQVRPGDFMAAIEERRRELEKRIAGREPASPVMQWLANLFRTGGAGGPAAGAAGAAAGIAESGQAEPTQFAAAALKGSQEAWHNLVMSMGREGEAVAVDPVLEEEKQQTALLKEARESWKVLAAKAGVGEKGQEFAAKTAGSVALLVKEATIQTRHLSNLINKIQVGELISIPEA